MNKLFIGVFILFGLLFIKCNEQKPETGDLLLVNHTGYVATGIKKVVFQTKSNTMPEDFEIINKAGETVYKGEFEKGGKIDNWHTGNACEGDFTDFNKSGVFYIKIQTGEKIVKSRNFDINNKSLAEKCLSLLINGFESQHPDGEYAEKDKKMSFFGNRTDTIDVSGGWYDASGEKGKYLSHLCFSNYFTPQQTPMFVWNLFESAKQYTKNGDSTKTELKNRLLKEAAYGADFLVRMQDSAGYFYTIVFANWSGDPKKREICAYKGQHGEKTIDYQAAFREGGGITIAALARASKEISGGAFSQKQYLEAAEKGFSHLVENNLKYCDDGKENIIDIYCALMAATELYRATQDTTYLSYARIRTAQLTNRLTDDENYKGWWRADEKGERPYFHGSEAGLPIIALCRYLDFETDKKFKTIAINTIRKSIDFELSISSDVNNPYGYPRQYVKAVNEDKKRAAFFLPHHNETGYWWQGENARLASIASAFFIARPYMTDEQNSIAVKFAMDKINWILGLNPYDVCMVDGIGFNNPDYKEGHESLNFKGCTANGITAGFTDETDIAFMPLPENDDPAQAWRWSEQWMPHGSWLMLAVAAAE